MKKIEVNFVDAFTICEALTVKKVMLLKIKAKQKSIDRLNRIIDSIREQMSSVILPKSEKLTQADIDLFEERTGRKLEDFKLKDF